MKPDPTEQPSWTWPYPHSWTQVYRDIAALLLGFLAITYLLDWLKGVLP